MPPVPPKPPAPSPPPPFPAASKRPNVVLILVDDQDLLLNSTHPYYMPSLNKYVAGKWPVRTYAGQASRACRPARTFLWPPCAAGRRWRGYLPWLGRPGAGLI